MHIKGINTNNLKSYFFICLKGSQNYWNEMSDNDIRKAACTNNNPWSTSTTRKIGREINNGLKNSKTKK